MILLKQSTAATVRVGPFVDITDGVTPETGVTLSGADQAEILKASGGVVDISGATWAAITNCAGWYDLSVTTGHSDTLGMLTIVVQDADVALPVFVRAMVVPAMIWDSLVGGTDVLQVDVTQYGGTNGTFTSGRPNVNASHLGGTSQTGRDIGASVLLSSGTGTGQISLTSGIAAVNVTQFGGSAGTFASGIPAVNATQISGDSTAADNLETAFDGTAGPVPELGILDRGTAQSATGTTLVLRSGITVSDDIMIGATIWIYSSTNGLMERRIITDWVSSTDTATVDAWTVTPTGTILYIVYPTPPASAGNPVPASLSSTELAKFFNTDTGTTYGSAVGGSVVKEIADNAGGSSLTVQDIVDGVWDEARSAHTDSGSFGQGVASVQGNVTGSVASVSGAVGSVTGAVGSVTGNVGGNVTGSVGSVTGNVGGTVNGLTSTAQGHVRTAVGLASANLDTQLSTIDSEIGTIDTVVDAVKVTTDKLDDTLEDQGGGTYGFTEAALQEAPSGGGGGGDATEAKQDQIIALIGTPVTDLAADLAAVQGDVTDILEDTATTIPGTLSGIETDLDNIETDTQNIQSRIPTALVSGRMNSNVAAVNGVVVQGSGTNGDSMRPA